MLTYAINLLREEFDKRGLDRPTVSIAAEDLFRLSVEIEKELGSQIYADTKRHEGIRFNGIWFRPEPSRSFAD